MLKVGDKIWLLHPQSGRMMAGTILEVRVFNDTSRSTRIKVDLGKTFEWCAIETVERMNDTEPSKNTETVSNKYLDS